MAGRGVDVLIMAMVVTVLGLVHRAAATVYVVNAPGLNGGWTYLSNRSTSYDAQFQNINLVVGDILTFTFDSTHNVYEVPPEDVATCDGSNPIEGYLVSVNVPLLTAGQHGYICTEPSHCSAYGMHLLVTVGTTAAPKAAPAPGTGASSSSSSQRSGLPVIIMAALMSACAFLVL
ncbi:unnamed protein product [Calypogeia fissa]